MNSQITILLTLLSAVFLAGCSVSKDWAASGGSRAAGTVDLSYQYWAVQGPSVDDAQGLKLASSTCAGWGYSAAKPFEADNKVCNQRSNNGCTCNQIVGMSAISNCNCNQTGFCLEWTVTRKYQCLGSPG